MRIAGGFVRLTRTPGTRLSFGRSSSMIMSAVLPLRSLRGFRSMFMLPRPESVVNAATFGSCWTMSISWRVRTTCVS